MTIEYAATPTLVPSPDWVDIDDDILEYVKNKINCIEFIAYCAAIFLENDSYLFRVAPATIQLEFNFISANKNGHVVIEILKPLSASIRGKLLLDFEEYLKSHVDPGITIWLAPLGDKNSLRNLRGIEMT